MGQIPKPFSLPEHRIDVERLNAFEAALHALCQAHNYGIVSFRTEETRYPYEGDGPQTTIEVVQMQMRDAERS